MTIALAMIVLAARDQAAGLLDKAAAEPADVIRAQITTQCRYIADKFEFVDEFHTDTMGPRKSSLSALEDLVSLGADAVPYLVSQLPDQSQTKLMIQGDKDTKVVAYEAYDPLARQMGAEYWDVVTMEQVNGAKPYVHAVTRGDLAYFALGQIVNRSYGILFPGKITLFCSASDHPAIQKQAQADWGKLTPAELQSLLRVDVKKPDTYARMVYGFSRYRNYFPGDSVDLAVEALRNTYGRWPMGKPDTLPRSFISELQPVAHWEIDQILYKWLSQTDKQNGFLDEYELTKAQILQYLKDRPNYRAICVKYAKDLVKEKKDRFGYIDQFLKKYGN
ncbi:MAG: hypothetical protein GC165_07895 [Armatimonadetes bacterium]|nr:hypothetical protein [Armatimonadota bacterium]